MSDYKKTQTSEMETDPELNLDTGDENVPLSEQLQLDDDLPEDEEFLPPEEENQARELNVGVIIGVAFILIIVIILIVMIAGSATKKKKQEESELDKAGYKTVIDFNRVAPNNTVLEPQGEGIAVSDGDEALDDEETDIDEILNTLPPEFQFDSQPAQVQGTAPVSPVGSYKSSSTSDRPDTRNSKSKRKIDNVFGSEPDMPDRNQDILSSVFDGTYDEKYGSAAQPRQSYFSGSPSGSYGNGLSKEDYISRQLQMMQQAQSGNQSVQQTIQNNRENFFNANAGAVSGQYLSYSSLWDGTIISGALVTAINTDNPGTVIARVTENVYSSYDHSFLLIPEGSLLFATYNSSVSYGQNKVQVAWNLLIRPDGYRVTLGNMPGVSTQGFSGYEGRVSNHPWQTMKALGMVALYSVIQTEFSRNIKSSENEYIQNAMTDVYTQTSELGNKIIDRALDIKPTITIKEGTEIKLITNIPLELPPVQLYPVTRKYQRTK